MPGRWRSNSAGSRKKRNREGDREDNRSLLAMVWIISVWGCLSRKEGKKGVERRKAASSSLKSGRVQVRGKQAKSK